MEKKITVIEKKLSPIAEEAQTLPIENEASMRTATILLSKLNQFNDNIKEEKEKVTKPLNEALRAERNRWKPVETMYENAIFSLRSKMTKYQTLFVRRNSDKEQAIANRIGEGKGKLTLETASKKLSELPRIQKEISTEAGSITFKEIRKFKIIDFSKIPRNYLILDDQLVREAMKSEEKIPGIEFYTEQIPYNKR